MSKKKLSRRFDFWFAEAIIKAATGINALGMLENGANGVIQFEHLDVDGKYASVPKELCAEELSFGDPTMFYSVPVATNGFTITQEELEQLLPDGITLEHALILAKQANDAEISASVAKYRALTGKKDEPRGPVEKAAAQGNAAKSDSPHPRLANSVNIAKVLEIAKKEMPGLDLKTGRAKWLTGQKWNLSQVAKYIEEGHPRLRLKAKTIRHILSAHRSELPPPKVV